MKRPCLGPRSGERCPRGALTEGSRCADCARVKDRARGTRQERGYDATYDTERRWYQARLDAGQVYMCWRCPELGRPPHVVNPEHWHLGHANDDRSVIRGPQCPESNLATSLPPTPHVR